MEKERVEDMLGGIELQMAMMKHYCTNFVEQSKDIGNELINVNDWICGEKSFLFEMYHDLRNIREEMESTVTKFEKCRHGCNK